MDVVIIRPPLVYGPDAPGNIGALQHAIRRGIPLPLGRATNNRRSLVHVETLARLIVAAIGHRTAPSAPLLVADPQPLSTRALVQRLADAQGLSARLLPIPVGALRAALRATGRATMAEQLLGDLVVDDSATRSFYGWVQREPWEAA